jgi:hypothetical protein
MTKRIERIIRVVEISAVAKHQGAFVPETHITFQHLVLGTRGFVERKHIALFQDDILRFRIDWKEENCPQ